MIPKVQLGNHKSWLVGGAITGVAAVTGGLMGGLILGVPILLAMCYATATNDGPMLRMGNAVPLPPVRRVAAPPPRRLAPPPKPTFENPFAAAATAARQVESNIEAMFSDPTNTGDPTDDGTQGEGQ
jgi:hypothetical protein